jgi:hypothetical protein
VDLEAREKSVADRETALAARERALEDRERKHVSRSKDLKELKKLLDGV